MVDRTIGLRSLKHTTDDRSTIVRRKERTSVLISNETDYAIRILRVLVDGKRHNMKELCESEFVPQQFAYKIVKKLADAEIVRSVRGVNGGCELIKDLKELTLYDLINIIDQNNTLADCLKSGDECPWKDRNRNYCSVHSHLWRIQNVLDNELKNHTLYEMFGDVEEKATPA